MQVAVIGVGSVGLVALKWALERGLVATGFDKEEGCGGVWRHGSPHSPAYDSLCTNSSTTLMNLSDFPFFKTTSKFPRHDEILRYFEAYRQHYDLDRHVRWNTRVAGIRKRELTAEDSRRWEVETENGQIFLFDAVLITTGKLWDPKLPLWLPSFQSTHPRVLALHSSKYRNPKPFNGKKLVLVGIGNSALDIALELALENDIEVSISVRRGSTVIPVAFRNMHPVDTTLANRFFQYKLPPRLRMLFLFNLVKEVNDEFQKAGLPKPPSGLFGPQSPTANLKQHEIFVQQLRKGKIKFVPEVVGFDKSSNLLELKDGSSVQADAVICCTGYTLRLSNFMERSLADRILKVKEWDGRRVPWLRLYQNMMMPDDPTLWFLGFITSFGNETCIGEMQARFATAVLAELVKSPTPQEIEENVLKLERNLDKIKPSVSGFVRYLPYMDALAERLDAKPKVGFLDDPWLWFKLTFRAVVPAQYRLQGLDARREEAVQMLAKL